MKKKSIKTVIKIVILAIIIAVIFLSPTNDAHLRVRVIANSDNSYDQTVKYAVVKLIKEEIQATDTKKEVEKKLPILETKIDKYLSKYNISYQIGITTVDFPPKELNGKIVPGGKYETLLVIIGEGEGKNWWSLLYPEYFNISFEDIESGDVTFKSYFFEKLFNN